MLYVPFNIKSRRAGSPAPSGCYPQHPMNLTSIWRASRTPFRQRRVSIEEGRETRRVAGGQATFGGDAIDAPMAARSGKAGGVASRVVVVDEAEIELGF